MSKNKFFNFKKLSSYHLILLFILLTGIILRFGNVPNNFIFDNDGVRDAIVAYEGAKVFSFPLTGPFSSTGPYTFGPWYYISIIWFSILFPLPYAPWLLMSIISLITIILMADIGRLLYSKKLGIILAAITAIAPTQINAATSLSNINPIPLFATLSIWISLKIIKKEVSHYLWYLFLGVSLGMGMNAHYQMTGLLLLPLIVWIFMGWRKFLIPLLTFAGILLTFIPLLIFNLMDHWSTLNGFKEMYIAKERTYVPNSWKIYLFQFWISHFRFLLFSPMWVNLTLVATTITAFVIDLVKKKYSRGFILLIVTFLINFIWLRYYWGERHDTYVYYLSPLIFIFFGYGLLFLWNVKYGKILFTLLCIVLGWNMLTVDYSRITERKNSMAWKEEAQLLRTKYPNNNIVIYSCNGYYEEHKKSLIYLLNLANNPQAEEKKIGLKGKECKYPITKELDANQKNWNKRVKEIYPPVIPDIKYANFSFIDLSPASPSAIKKAKWKSITAKDIYNSSVNWWRK